MLVADAQREVRSVYAGGFFGQLVSGVLWLTSAALGTWRTPRAAILCLVIGGMLIFPLTTLLLRLSGRPASLSKGNPLNALALQLPLSMPLVAAITVHDRDWFYPSMMVLAGAHYLPFVFLYGMPMFGVLCGLLVTAGIAVAHHESVGFAHGGWVTGVILVVFAFVGRVLVGGRRG